MSVYVCLWVFLFILFDTSDHHIAKRSLLHGLEGSRETAVHIYTVASSAQPEVGRIALWARTNGRGNLGVGRGDYQFQPEEDAFPQRLLSYDSQVEWREGQGIPSPPSRLPPPPGLPIWAGESGPSPPPSPSLPLPNLSPPQGLLLD